jgi:putative transposase
MKTWFSADELASLELPGFPATKRGINEYAEREGWTSKPGKARLRSGRGGGVEYHVDLLPPETLAIYASRLIGAVEPSDSIARAAASEPSAGKLAASALEARDARLALVSAANRFARDGKMPFRTADAAFCALYNARAIDVSDWIRAHVKELSARSLRRWRDAVDAEKATRLAVDRGAARRGKGALETAFDGAVKTFVLAHLARQPHLSAHHLRALVCDAFPDFEAPPVRTFQRQAALWKVEHRVALTQITNPDAFKSHFRVAARGSAPASRLNEVWQVDASPADVLCKDGRHSIYASVDMYSRRLIVTVTRTPRASAVGLLVRRCILEWGVPDRVKTDNGSDFRAKFIQRLFASLAVEVEVSAPFSPEQKGAVERAIGTLQRDLMPLLPGFIGHSVADRKVIEARKAFAQRLGDTDEKAFCVELTAAELQKYCDEWAKTRYQHRPHEGLKGATPFEVASAWDQPIRRVEDARALDLLLAPVAGRDGLRTVTKSGVRIDGSHYLTPSVLPGEEVFVRMDPADMGRALLFTRDGSTYLGEAVCPQLAGVDPAKAVAEARAEQKRILDEGSADLRKRMKAIKPRDMVDAVLRTAARDAGSLIEFPKRSTAYSTPQIEAAGEAASPAPQADQVAQISESVRAMQAQVEADLAGEQARAGSAEGAKVAPLRTQATPQQRFRRALDLQRALKRGEEIANADAVWLGAYEQGAEYRGLKQVFDDFGEEALR